MSAEFVFPLWLLSGTAAVSWYTYDCAKTKTKFDGGGFWLVLGLGPIALAVMIAEVLGKRAASGIDARQRRDAKQLDPKGESPVPERQTPKA